MACTGAYDTQKGHFSKLPKAAINHLVNTLSSSDAFPADFCWSTLTPDASVDIRSIRAGSLALRENLLSLTKNSGEEHVSMLIYHIGSSYSPNTQPKIAQIGLLMKIMRAAVDVANIRVGPAQWVLCPFDAGALIPR